MMDILSTALSGIQASRNRALASANNVANVNTAGYQAKRANTSTGPNGQGAQTDSVSFSTLEGNPASSNVDIAQEIINLKVEENITRANINTAKTADDITKTTIDLLA